VVAKSTLYGTPGPWAGRTWWEWVLPFHLGGWPPIGDLNLTVPLSVLLAPAAVVGLARAGALRTTGLGPLVAGTLAVWAGYSLLGVAYFYWYLLVPLAGLGVLAAIGLPSLLRGRAVYASLLLALLGSWTMARLLYVGRARKEAIDFGRASRFLFEHARPGETVVLEPIGLVGYENPALRVVDEVGLVSPAVTRRRLSGAGWYPEVIARSHADWVVVRRAVLERGDAFAGAGAPFRDAAERDSLLARFGLADPGNDFAGDQALLVLRRR